MITTKPAWAVTRTVVDDEGIHILIEAVFLSERDAWVYGKNAQEAIYENFKKDKDRRLAAAMDVIPTALHLQE